MAYQPNRSRLEKRLEQLKNYRIKIESMASCHIVEHKFYDYTPDHSPMFYGNKDAICHGLDAAGDLSGGFALIKEGMLKEVDFDIQGIERQLSVF